jgi:NTE family protein
MHATRDKKRIIFGGAGTRLLCYVGALRALVEDGYTFTEFVGVSAGSIIATLLALGLTVADLEKTIIEYDFRSMFHPDPFAPDHILEAMETWGLDDGSAFRSHIGRFLEDHGFSPRITFEQLAKLTRTQLRVLACDVESATYYELSAKATPKVQIVDAVYASCAIPIYFQPARINGRLLVDGGLIHSFPLTFFNKQEITESIGLQIKSVIGKCTPRTSLDYFWRVCGLILNPPAPYQVPDNIYSIKVASFFINVSLTDTDKITLIAEGYSQVKTQIASKLKSCSAIRSTPYYARRHSI